MRRAMLVALGTGAVISSAAALGIAAAGGATAANPGKEEYEAALRAVMDAHDPAVARCTVLAGYAREYCRAAAEAETTIRVAELEAAYRRTERTERAALRARIDARHQLDRARCKALGGFQRDECMVRAHAARGRALLEAAAPYANRF